MRHAHRVPRSARAVERVPGGDLHADPSHGDLTSGHGELAVRLVVTPRDGIELRRTEKAPVTRARSINMNITACDSPPEIDGGAHTCCIAKSYCCAQAGCGAGICARMRK